jgi:pimeloyl-ACP methyl ester carboxylesterase
LRPDRRFRAIAAVTSGLVATAGCNARTPSNAPFRVPAGLAVTVRGRGPDVVLIHGALGDYRNWEPIGVVLSSRYRVIAVSRRFHWPNPPPTAHVIYSFEAQSEDLNALLDSLHRPVHLVGHSYGAGVALLTTLHHPELVRSLTLIEPPFGSLVPPSTPGFAAELASRDSLVAALRVNVQAGAVERAAEGLIDWVEGEPGGFRRLPQATQDEFLTNAATAGPTYARPGPAGHVRATAEASGAGARPPRRADPPLVPTHRRGHGQLHRGRGNGRDPRCKAYDDRGEPEGHRESDPELYHAPRLTLLVYPIGGTLA